MALEPLWRPLVVAYTPTPMPPDRDLAALVDAAQSILATPAAEQARVLERALAQCCAASARAMAKLDASSRASCVEVAGGLAIFAGAGSPMTQGLAMGLARAVTAADLDAMERHLSPAGPGRVQLEVCPYVDPSLLALLAARGYRVHEWQLAWTGAIPEHPIEPPRAPDAALRVRPIRPGEEDVFSRCVLAGFLETDDVPDAAFAMMRHIPYAEHHEVFLAFLGDEPIGGAGVAWSHGVAILSGSGVRPAFRRRGAQGALLRARLERARQLGCTVGYSNTLPGTASRRNMERHGLHVAYPKLVMLREG
jgi:GNAT superfamily N-acetyltransferase